MKYKINATIDHDLHRKAKEKGLNVSAILNTAIAKKLESTKVDIGKPDKCEFCGREEPKATAQRPRGLTWLWPDERWICNSCLKSKMNQVHIGQ